MAMLGPEGALTRVAALATIYQGDMQPDDWCVSTLHAGGDGGIYVTIFSGPEARERALEYATAKYSGFVLRD